MEGKINKYCGSCASACCGPRINIELSNEERDFLRSAGTNLLPINHPSDNNTDSKLYSLESKCGFVVVKDGLYKCSEHNNPRRPAICGRFKAGGKICKNIKESRRKGIGYEFGY
jgi:Fe-S-cluster containining protein